MVFGGQSWAIYQKGGWDNKFVSIVLIRIYAVDSTGTVYKLKQIKTSLNF